MHGDADEATFTILQICYLWSICAFSSKKAPPTGISREHQTCGEQNGGSTPQFLSFLAMDLIVSRAELALPCRLPIHTVAPSPQRIRRLCCGLRLLGQRRDHAAAGDGEVA